MGTIDPSAAGIDLDKFRLRRFVERLIAMGEMEVREDIDIFDDRQVDWALARGSHHDPNEGT